MKATGHYTAVCRWFVYLDSQPEATIIERDSQADCYRAVLQFRSEMKPLPRLFEFDLRDPDGGQCNFGAWRADAVYSPEETQRREQERWARIEAAAAEKKRAEDEWREQQKKLAEKRKQKAAARTQLKLGKLKTDLNQRKSQHQPLRIFVESKTAATSIYAKHEQCPCCRGSGFYVGGHGHFGEHHHYRPVISPCPSCEGTGQTGDILI